VLKASASRTPAGKLDVRVSIQNSESTPVYVFNRLWMLDAASKIVTDPREIYRYVHDKTLRLLLGNAPLPRFKQALFRNVPVATPVPPGKTLEQGLDLSLPVYEYSPYFKGEKPTDYETIAVDFLEVFVDYVPAGPKIITRPSAFDPTAVAFETPGIWDYAVRLRSGPIALKVPVLKRTDAFDRLFLPNESPDSR
jgi:hypothetical protein